MERWRSLAVLGALSMHTSRVRIPYAPPFSGPKCCRVACLLCKQEGRVRSPADPPVLGAWPNGKAPGSQPGNRGFESRCSCHLTHECGGSGIRPRLRAVVMRVRIPPLVPSRRLAPPPKGQRHPSGRGPAVGRLPWEQAYTGSNPVTQTKRLSSSGRIGRRHRPDTGSNPVSLSNESASKAHGDEQPAFNRWAASSRLAGGTNHCGSSGGPWAHNPKVEAGFNSLTRNQSQMPSTIHAPVRYPVSRPLSESGVSVRSTRTWGTNRTAHPVPFSVGLWGGREGHDQPSPNRSRQDLGELSGMASHPSGRRTRPLS